MLTGHFQLSIWRPSGVAVTMITSGEHGHNGQIRTGIGHELTEQRAHDPLDSGARVPLHDDR